VTSSGRVLRPPGATTSLPVEGRARDIARTGDGRYLTDREVGGTHLRVLTRGTGNGGAVQVARPLDEIDHQLSRLLVALAVLGAVGVALGVGLGAFVARTALVPIGRFTSRTEELSSERDLSQRIEVVGDDELARLARSFNTTLDALESAVEAQRHLVADASHELRTPIASLRANVQNLEDAERLPRPGFREEDLPHVFERFYRAPAARGMSGSGLGLAIVQQAAEAHGGFVEACNAPEGGALLRAGFGPGLKLEEAPEPVGQA